MWSYHEMIDFPITDLRDDDSCTRWLERHLHPEGLNYPHCRSYDRRLCRAQDHFPAYGDRRYDGYAPTAAMLGTAFEADELYQNAGEKQHARS
jgi:hypothetical protein